MIPVADIVWDKREQSRIEAQIKKQQELKLIGSMKKVPGHTLFSFNYKTGEIKPADVIRECAMGFDGLLVYKERIVVEKDCYYEQALNVKNGEKIFEGDIVKWDDQSNGRYWRFAVVRIDPDIQFDCSPIDCINGVFNSGRYNFRYACFAYKDTDNYLSVIGNIHDNADLIK